MFFKHALAYLLQFVNIMKQLLSQNVKLFPTYFFYHYHYFT